MRDSRKSLRNVAQASDSSASDIIKDFKRKRIADGTRTTYSGPQKDIINFMREYHPGDFDENGDIIFPLNSAHVKEFFASLLKFAHNRLKHQTTLFPILTPMSRVSAVHCIVCTKIES
jgi:hypothetical protein